MYSLKTLWMRLNFSVWALIAIWMQLGRNVDAHSYHLGECPMIEPMPSFEMSRMLGIWYVIQKTGTASSCMVYNFTRTDEPGEFELRQTSQHFALGLTPLEHQYHYTGRLTVRDAALPARMTVRFPLSVAGTAAYTVFATDYDNYAGIFTCQRLSFAHRESATILARQKTLEKMYVDKLRSKLSQANIDPFELSLISQTKCPKLNAAGSHNIDIDADTFSVKSVAQVIRKAGEKIGDGVEYVAGGAKKVYDKVAASASSETADGGGASHGKLEETGKRGVTVNPEAEWLP